MRYAPAGPTLARFMTSEATVRGIMGPYGSGKSVACVAELLRVGMNQAPDEHRRRRTRMMVVRKTYPELITTTIQTWKDWRPAEIGQLVMSARPIVDRIRYRLNDGTSVEQDVYFCSLDREDDLRKVLSLELTFGWINEARDQHRSLVLAMRDRCKRFPKAADGGPTRFGLIMDTNPPPPDHWWHEWAEESTPDGFAFFKQPPGDSPEAENLRWLPAGYYGMLKQGATEDEIRVKVRGDYGYMREGKRVYPDYADHVHCADQIIEPRRDVPLHIGLDFGWSAAAIVGQRWPGGLHRVLGELVTDDIRTAKFGAELLEWLADEWRGFDIASITGDPAGLARSPLAAEDQPETHIDILRSLNIDVQAAPTNDIGARIEAVAGALTRMVDGAPAYMVSKRAKMLRKGFNGRYEYARRGLIGGDTRYDDKPLKNEFSHPHDAEQYRMLGVRGLPAVLGRKTTPRPPPPPPNKRRGAWMR